MNKKILSAIIVGIFVLFYLLKDILFPFVAGVGIAYFFDPLTCYFEKKLKSRVLSVSLIFLISTLVVLIGLLIFVPIIKKQVVLLVNNIPGYLNVLWVKADPLLTKLKEVSPNVSDNIRESLNGHVSSISKFAVASIKRVLSGSYVFLNFISLAVIAPVVAFYLMCDWKDFCSKIKGLLPVKSADMILKLYYQMDTMLSGFVRGQATVCGCLAIYYATGLSIAGLDFGILLGLCIGCVTFIPFVGVGLGFVASMILGIIQFDTYSSLIGVLIVFGIGQVLEGYFLTPKLVGGKVGLHPVWIMFALLAGGVLFGFLGVVIAVPTAALIGVLIRFFVDEYKKSDIYLG
ncbi:MAG: AI-2E family transporter [Alphaproteobacteria bacterium]|nr:AI-2E family transporter [Alphaproteobacteria bacterium]